MQSGYENPSNTQKVILPTPEQNVGINIVSIGKMLKNCREHISFPVISTQMGFNNLFLLVST